MGYTCIRYEICHKICDKVIKNVVLHQIAQDSTTDLFDHKTITIQDEYSVNHDGVIYTYYQVIDILAEAIQANPTQAVTDSWGVQIGSNKVITGVN